MNEHTIRTLLEGNGGAAGTALRALLYAPGKAYGEIMRARRRLYEIGAFPSAAAPVPVISIGNITAGGSGKTPFTALLANHFLQNGQTPAILLRGYRAQGETGSDEANLYKRLAPGAIIKVGSNRAASAAEATEEGANILLMDDGFQHLRLRRNLDIVLIDAASPWGGGNTIPGGLLREPLAALKRANILVITRSDQAPEPTLQAITARLKTLAPDAPIFTARHAPARLRADGEAIPLESLRGKNVVMLSGIARPEAFKQTLKTLGAKIAAEFIVNDHQNFPPDFMAQARSRAKELNAPIITTEKDEAKNPPVSPLWILGINQELDNPAALLRIVDEAAGG